MTREEAIAYFKRHIELYCVTGICREAEEMAIKALEQESVFDKIRAEIKALSNANPSYWHSGDMVEREEVFEIIDKYKAESEDKE